MVSDAPEFFHGLANLDSIIRSEAYEQPELNGTEGQSFNEILAQIVERRQVEIRDRLSNILAVRADICIGDDMSTLVGTCHIFPYRRGYIPSGLLLTDCESSPAFLQKGRCPADYLQKVKPASVMVAVTYIDVHDISTVLYVL